MKGILAVLGLVLIFVLSQIVLYWWEGGIRVADSYADPPLSEIFHARFREPLAETSKRSLSHLPILKRWSYWRALRKFPTLEYCLKSPRADNDSGFDFDWKAMRTSEQAQLCLHHVSVKLAVPAEIVAWLNKEGFAAEAYYSSGKMSPQVDAKWRVASSQKYHPFGVISWMQINMLDPFRTGDPINVSIDFQSAQVAPIAIKIWFDAQF